MDFDRLFVSVVVACNESDVRSIFEYKTDDIRVIPLYVKSSANCCSNSVSQYNENSAWKMALDISDDEKWMERNMTLSKEIEARLGVVLESVVKNDAYINPKLLAWEGTFRIFTVLIYHSVTVWGEILCWKSKSFTDKVKSITRKFLSKNVRSQKATYRLNHF